MSLRSVTYPDINTVVVDNGSTDDSIERLRSEFPLCNFILNGKNLGFARGCNIGIQAALHDGRCAYVLLLNNDATLLPNSLESAIRAAEMNGLIGVVGGKILESPVSRRISYAGGSIDRLRAGCRVRGSSEIDRGQYDTPREVGFITGALMLIKRNVLETVGLLPEEYFFSVEDLDYSLNVRRTGYKLYYVPQFIAYHAANGSHWTFDPKFSYNGYRSRFIFQQKYLRGIRFSIWQKAFVVYEKHINRLILKRRWRKFGMESNRAIPFNEMDFALKKAVEDHGKDALSEESLIRFAQQLEEKKATSTRTRTEGAGA